MAGRRRKRTKMLIMLLKEIGPDYNHIFGVAFENVIRKFYKNATIPEKLKAREQLIKDYDSLVGTLHDHNICFHPSLITQKKEKTCNLL